MKRNGTPTSGRLKECGGFDSVDLSVGSHGDLEVCVKCGGTHGFDSHKFRCFKCGERGHVHRDCKKDQICFHCHQPGHFKSLCPILEVESVQVSTPMVPQEVKIEPQ